MRGPGSKGSTAPRRLGAPQPVAVRAEHGGYPREVDGVVVEAVRESWLVEDRWWAPTPVRRRYWEVVTRSGQNLVVFRDLRTDAWYRQTAMG